VVVSGDNASDARDEDGNPLPSPFSWQVRCDLHVFQSRQGQLLRWCPVLCHEFCCHIMRPGSTVKPCGIHWDPFCFHRLPMPVDDDPSKRFGTALNGEFPVQLGLLFQTKPRMFIVFPASTGVCPVRRTSEVAGTWWALWRGCRTRLRSRP
jgi:hypothetical protein